MECTAGVGQSARRWVAVDFGGPAALREVTEPVRARIIELAAQGRFEVRIAQVFPFGQAPAALAALTGPHPPGKLALVANPAEGPA